MDDLIEKINRFEGFEEPEMTQEEVVEFFQELLDMGYIQHLQGTYQRTTADLYRAGLIR